MEVVVDDVRAQQFFLAFRSNAMPILSKQPETSCGNLSSAGKLQLISWVDSYLIRRLTLCASMWKLLCMSCSQAFHPRCKHLYTRVRVFTYIYCIRYLVKLSLEHFGEENAPNKLSSVSSPPPFLPSAEIEGDTSRSGRQVHK